MPSVSWQGVYPAVTTQFRSDFSVDVPATLTHVEALIAAGVHGLIMLGSVGENCALDFGEKIELLKATAERVRHRVPVLSGVAETSTHLACRYAQEAARCGADGLMVLPAMVYKADGREAIAHFRTVAAATPLPVMIYNNPVAYSVDLTPPMFAELADLKTIVAIKESSDNVRRITDLVNTVGDRFTLFCGVDDLALEAMFLGATGWVSGLVNAFPRENMRLWNHALAGRWEEARALYRWFTPLLHLDTHVKLVQYIKLCMAEVGLGTETVRMPRLPISGAERERILGLIRHALATRPA